jgi:hypothetical protein
LLAAPLLVVPTALLGAGVAVFAMKESIATHLKNVPSPRRRKAYKAMYIGTAPVWVVGLGAIGAATLLASAAGCERTPPCSHVLSMCQVSFNAAVS